MHIYVYRVQLGVIYLGSVSGIGSET